MSQPKFIYLKNCQRGNKTWETMNSVKWPIVTIELYEKMSSHFNSQSDRYGHGLWVDYWCLVPLSCDKGTVSVM
jgi:hypothetical protein